MLTDIAVPDEIVALEEAERRAFADLYTAAPPDTADALGLAVSAVGDGVLLSVSRIDVLGLNRLLGLGVRTPTSDAVLDDALRAMEKTAAPRMFVQVAPVRGSEELAAGLERRGLVHYNNWMRLRRSLREVHAITAPASDVTVRAAEAADAGVFGRLVADAFGFPPEVASIVTQVIGRPQWRHYLACAGQTPIGAAAMYVWEDAAWFGFAATDQAHRKRGAQHALVVRRLREAAAEGCRWVSVETAEETMTRGAPSFRNLSRLGFEAVYRRPNYIWTKPR